MTTATIKRSQTWHRPLIADGKEISRIILHDGKKVLATIYQGWLEHVYDTDKEDLYYNTRDVTAILGIELRHARTANLAKCDHFTMTFNDREQGYQNKGTSLYLYVPNFKFIKTMTRDHGLEIMSVNYFTFPLSCLVNTPYLDENKKLHYRDEPIANIVIEAHRKWTPTEFGAEVTALTEALNKALGKDTLSTYYTEKLLKVFEIKKIEA